jgi:hypothetical protein
MVVMTAMSQIDHGSKIAKPSGIVKTNFAK